MSLGFFKSFVLTLMLAVTLGALSSTVSAQESVSQTCAQLGFKPGTKGHTDCVSQNSGVGGRVAPKPANPAPAAKAPVVPVITAEQREDKFWDDAKAIGNKEAYQGYLNSYPAGRYVDLARAILTRLSPAPANNRPPGTTFKDCPDCPEMVAIPAGSFEMGSKADPFASSPPSTYEQPQHSVTIKAFAIGKYEVTQEQWYAVMGMMPSYFKGRTLPVEQVSWEDTQEFVKKLSEQTGKNYRLPTEAEWEYAARAGSQTAYSFGDNEGELARFGWFTQNSKGTTHPVGEKQVNSFGLHDMHGNVWEWTQDCWGEDYTNAPADGSAWTAGDCPLRVVRGGSWDFNPQFLRSANRGGNSAAFRFSFVGFRVARTD